MDRKGLAIEYYLLCPTLRLGSTAPPLKNLMKTHAASTIVTYQSSKCKAAKGTTHKTITRKNAPQNETIICSSKIIHPLPKMIFNF